MNKYIKTLFILLAASLLPACNEESVLEVASVQQNYDFEEMGGTKFATVKSDKIFTAVSDQQWCETEIYPGNRNNNLRITTGRNESAEIRTAVIVVAAEGLSAVQITVTQEAATPFISVTEKSIEISKTNLEFSLEIASNVLFAYELPEWIKPKEGNRPAIGKTKYYFTADALTSHGERNGNIIIKAADGNVKANASVVITQTNDVLPVLNERFDWAVSSSTDIYTSTGEVRIDNWPADGKIWTSSTPGVNDIWTRKGYLKFCRGNTGADLISPKLAGIVGTEDVIVTFKACAYLSATGVKDKYSEFNISIIGGGTPDITHFEINNYPDTQENEHGVGWLWQNDAQAEYKFTITGATPETQIRFLAGPKLGVLDGNSRMGLDDVKVVLK